MKSFVVDWKKSAELQLAAIWLQASDPNAITRASALIEQLLAQDPIKNGHHLSEGLFKLKISPLAVFYIIDQIRRAVSVTAADFQP